jgi:hypothetical protein
MLSFRGILLKYIIKHIKSMQKKSVRQTWCISKKAS